MAESQSLLTLYSAFPLTPSLKCHGCGTSVAKFDVVSAYRNVGIHPSDRPLLGMNWLEQYLVDMTHPFGLRLAPFIFTAIADLVEWILVHNYGVEFLRHYLDDLFTLGPPASPVFQNNLTTRVQPYERLGLPLHLDKLERPATCLTMLRIELDSVKLQISCASCIEGQDY